MRMFSFIPHARRRVPPNPTTDYRGGWVTTTNPLNPTKADAIVATQLFEATRWAALFEGMGLEFERGSHSWEPRSATGEGLNPLEWHARHNGAVLAISWNWRLPAVEWERDLHAEFRTLPIDSIVSVREYGPTMDGLAHRLNIAPVTETMRERRRLLRYTLRTTSFFYRWEGRQTVVNSAGVQVSDIYKFLDQAVGRSSNPDPHPYPLTWTLNDRDILERTWFFTLGQGHRHPIDALAIGTRSAHGTIVTSPHTGDYHCADDGKVTPLDATTVRECDSTFDERHESTVSIG
ncbi:hypothetical protein [Gordonia soli]|uniref:Uncharacterized protein n=1 Tax=Gordonia soli NBRC 108243 TaxID=1223545 RepID=M0QL06_9ACTN|nr:hypothetical protein [Gordonia soli]GAC69325.1 hypothetical protein GS4_23_01220 [Gordonia soli NBRC 108243]